MILDFLTPSGTTMPIEVEESSNVYRSVSEGNRFEFTIKCETPITLPLGSTVKVEGYTYTLFYPLECRKENTEHYVHSGMMHGEEEALKMVKIKDAGQEKPVLSFVLTGKPIDFVRFVAKSMGSDWQVGDVVDGAVKTLAFKHEYCWDAIRRVCEEYQTEFRVEGKTIHLRKLELNKDNPLPLSYGMGKGFLPGVGIRSDSDTQRIGRLFVEGSSRNINPSTYGAMTLQLPKSATFEYEGTTYSTDETGSFIKGKYYGTSLAEESFDGTEIYPCREGAVSKAETTPKGFVDFFDDSIPEALNFNDYRIPGEKAMVVFLSGMLQGREFEIAQTKDALTGYKHEERRFQLVPSEQDGFTMPGGIYMPAVGDRYAIYGISLPPTYTEKASMELFHEGCKFLHKLETSRFKFDGKLDPSYTHAKWLEIGGKVVPGSYILFSDPDIFPKGEKIRVVAIQHPIDRPFAAELTLTNASEGGYIGNQLGKLAAESILRKQEQRSQQRSQRQDYRQALEHIGMVEKAVEGIEGFSKRIKPSVVETMSVLVGSQATQFDFVERYGSMTSTNVAVNYDKSNQRVGISSGVLRHQTIGITSMSNKRKASEYRYWVLPRYDSPALDNAAESYYVYAKVSREGRDGVYLLSDKPVGMEEVEGYYHLLIGTLSSAIDNDRAYNRLYGYSMITPGQMVVNTISSANGRMRIDLETGEIISDVIKFRRPDGREQGVDEAIEKERREREQADAVERRAREAKEREFTQAIEQAKQSGAQDVATLTDLLHKANQKLGALEKQVDKEVSNWFYPGAPSATKLPESEWTTNALKANHINDTYTSIDKSGRYQGKSWRYTTEYKWQEIHDTQISQALSMAAKAQTTADGKSTTYLAKPTKYEEGDTWVLESTQVVNGTRYEKGTYLFATQSSSVFVQAHWVDKLKYISKSETESKIKASESASKLAWERYARAQAEAERVKAEAHADGKVTAEEQARIDAVQKALQAAREHAEAQDKLLKAQQEAYADGKVTAAERNAIAVSQARAKLAEENAKAYADGIVDKEEKARIAAAQKAYDDAVAKAKELDGQIQVGGRNLLLDSGERINNNKYLVTNYKLSDEGKKLKNGDEVTIVLKGKLSSDKECFLVYNSGGMYEVANIRPGDKLPNSDIYYKTAEWRGSDKTANTFVSLYAYPDKDNAGTQVEWIKIVAGNKSSIDYTEAPEDVQAEIDAVERGYQKLIERVDVEFANSNSRDTAPTSGWQTNAPTPARGQALWQRTKVYLKDGTEEVRGTTCIQGKNGQDGADGRGIAKIVELYYLSSSNTALANGAWTETAPTPKEGFWIWTKTRIHYTTGEQIETQPICVTGNKGADAVVSKVVTIDTSGLDENMYYPIAITDIPTSVQNRYRVYTKLYYSSNPSWATHEKGFQCELIWRCYNSSWGGFDVNMQVEVASYKFVNNVPPISQPSQIEEYSVNYTYVRGGGKYYVELQAREQATLDDITVELVTAKKSYGRDPYIRYLEPQTSITAPITDLDKEAKAREKVVQEINAGLSNANTLIATLEKTAKELKEGKLDIKDLPDLQYLLNALQKGDTKIAGGLVLTNSIILSEPINGKVTAVLSGSAADGHKALRLGIKDGDKELTALRNDGTGHIGQLHFDGDRIVVAPIGDITAAFMEFGKNVMRQTIQEVLRNNGYDNTANLGSMGVTSGSEIKRKTFDVVNDGTLVTITMTLTVKEQYHTHGSRREFESVYKITNAYLDGETNLIYSAFSELDSRDIGPHGGGQVYYYPEKSEKVSYTVRLPKGQHTISIKTNFGAGSATGIKVRQVYTTNYRQTSFSDKGMRIYGGPNNLVDFNHDHPHGTCFATIKGGLDVDYIETSGAVLAGAQFNASGSCIRQFGRYANKVGQNSAQAGYIYATNSFTVYHSIGHSNYVPMITMSQADAARIPAVSNIQANSFVVQTYSGFSLDRASFNYVCFKAD